LSKQDDMKRKGPSWLSSAVFYQIYPPSFYDGNGDGIGDLGGIIEKLDYVQSLGCNGVWLNPCFASPFRDGGYDVTDYYRVAPRYGTNRDLKRLFKAAERRGIKVCLDLVAGHTSIDHPWFQASSRAESNPYSDWYIWTRDWTESAEAGLTEIRGYGERNGNYLANFFWSQPALNYGFDRPDPDKPWQKPVGDPACRAVREEMIKIMRYWLDRGAAGFRVDMAGSLVKNDKEARKTSEFWREVRAMLDRDYPEAVLIAEWSNPAVAIKAGFHVDFFIHFNTPGYTSLFRQEGGRDINFSTTGHSFFSRAGKGDVSEFLDNYLDHYRKTKGRGYISIPTGNHDLPRISLGRTRAEIELVFAFILTMPGIPFIYYGDEIGMRYLPELPGKEGGYTRTGARTPMQWGPGKNAGFSSGGGKTLYLPIDPERDRPTVAEQETSDRSLLNRVRKLAALRKENTALGAEGEFYPVFAEPQTYPFVYLRKLHRAAYLVGLNPAGYPGEVTLPLSDLNQVQLAMSSEKEPSLECGSHAVLKMPPLSYGIYTLSIK